MEFLNQLAALSNAFLGFAHQLGILLIPIIIVVLGLANIFGGRDAMRNVGVGIATAAVMLLLITNAATFGKWLSNPTVPTGITTPGTPTTAGG